MRRGPTEAEFQAQVIQLARLRGWRVAHFRPARTAKGWRTAVAADGVGWPDLFLVRGGRVIAAELKVGNNRLSPQQTAWLTALRAADIPAVVWRPTMWPEIEEALE
jgi:hypothetical protein